MPLFKRDEGEGEEARRRADPGAKDLVTFLPASVTESRRFLGLVLAAA